MSNRRRLRPVHRPRPVPAVHVAPPPAAWPPDLPPARPGCDLARLQVGQATAGRSCDEGTCTYCAYVEDVMLECGGDELCVPGKCEACDVEWFTADPAMDTLEAAETIAWAGRLRDARSRRLAALEAAGYVMPEGTRR